MSAHVLIVDDETNLSFFLKEELEEKKYLVDTAASISEAKQIINSTFPDIMLLDLNLPDGNGLDFFQYLTANNRELPTIVITAHASINSAIDAMKLGVDDYLVKPFELDEVLLNIEKLQQRFKLKSQFNYYKKMVQNTYPGEFFISKLPHIEEIQKLAAKIGSVEDSKILIEGQSGSGKEMLAKFIHHLSINNTKPFIEINCASLQENLLESELFGYEAGAFTDAKTRKIGLIELADGGTLFLDEISEMKPALQAKLLRFLETQTFKRVGGIRDIKVNVRIIAATNSDISKMVEEKTFRQDLLFRLNMFHIKLPPLIERREEVLLIAQFFLEKKSKKLRRNITDISPEAQQMILNYNWPGNFRELHNAIERAVILCESTILCKKHLPSELINRDFNNSFPQPSLDILSQVSLKGYMESIEKSLLIQALQITSYNQIKAAEMLGEPRHIIRYLMKKHGLNKRAS
jgi:two-component system response regulator AtoC